MATDQPELRTRGRSFWGQATLLGSLLSVLCVLSWPLITKELSFSLHDKTSTVISPGVTTPLLRRDEYACNANKPCKNGACCGTGGYCGFGPTYCGAGCLSNCNATAECGEFAKKCQSNCVLNPMPPVGTASTSILQRKVIGYYEAWMARKSCHKMTPTDLPLDALTHVNFAFASIDPSTYQVVTMDSETPASLFKETTNIKSIKQDLSVYVSIGGWTFSDNNTATQPLFGEIAASESKRRTFAQNTVHFMQQYGFDGVDIDWEYPGAGDRGGKPEDTENYVLLLKTMREVFDKSGGDYGLTFTAPSSYWYLRWFDLEKMVKYVNWINVMTYDLHGVWDAENPIGSIVQGHTNLTEIKTALELFWRVDINPSKLVLGFGFYGRSFTLSDPECSKPGCPFKGASDPGPCSNTGGMLGYYEIMSILDGASGKKRAKITPTHDKDAAVNYFIFDDDQWVSYDDKTTFKQKVDWADTIGMGGAMIWASDLDDDKYSAHAGLTGKKIISTADLQTINKAISNPESVIDDLSAFDGQKCFKYDGKCVNLNDNEAMSRACGAGNTVVGWDDAGCGTSKCHCGKPICCPTKKAPKNCMWRGDNTGTPGVSSDCSGQCQAGEININGIRSSWGGGPQNDGDTDKCGRGYKIFCCPDPDYNTAKSQCSYADCGQDCPAGKISVLTKYDNCWRQGQKYCCPIDTELKSCHWRGGGGGSDCANAKCNATEVQIDLATYGDKSKACDWGRSKAACCTITKAPVRKATCSTNLCSLMDEFCLDDGGERHFDKRQGLSSAQSHRSSHSHGHSHSHLHHRGAAASQDLIVVEPEETDLTKRGASSIKEITMEGYRITVRFAGWPPISELFKTKKGKALSRTAYSIASGPCSGRSCRVYDLSANPTPKELKGLETEHPWDVSQNPFNLTVRAKLARRPAVGVGGGAAPATLGLRLAEAFGSTRNRYPFLPTWKQLNLAKGRALRLESPVSIESIRTSVRRALQSDTNEDVDALFSKIQMGLAAFQYMQEPGYHARFSNVHQEMYRQLYYGEQAWGQDGLQDWWEAWSADHLEQVARMAQDWASDALGEVWSGYVQARIAGRHLQTYDSVTQQLLEWEDEIAKLYVPKPASVRFRNPDNGEGPSNS
ncbi:predicted protein [Aspergillus terreus NIH2624]|uniref:chitinase n=1 Tax=Aspergillus terreus (strain NIH 2624 / FGSC A1156) TaxID=341663 RepID=Q0CGX0_ASPTN|nr:uncharacterized protein ATEG_07072 [Aspergillus terreus NIH2624]EAU32456.1 predicted protein [Aspergillus terreus NIH2624]